MNIFEALEAGNGRATLAVYGGILRYCWKKEYEQGFGSIDILWNDYQKVSREDLKRNDWIPYVKEKPKDVPCETEGNNTPEAWRIYYSAYNKFLSLGFTYETIRSFLKSPLMISVPREICKNCEGESWPGRAYRVRADGVCPSCGKFTGMGMI